MTGIRGTTTLVGLLGWPTSHSLSPPMQNAGFAALGLDWAYVPLPTAPELLGEAVRGLVVTGFAGANVTIPHKQAVIAFCDDLDEVAERAGSVNTLLFQDGRVLGSSTDGAAVTGQIEAAGRRALVLGAGGSAKAVVDALTTAGAERVETVSRRDEALAPFRRRHRRSRQLHAGQGRAGRRTARVDAGRGSRLPSRRARYGTRGSGEGGRLRPRRRRPRRAAVPGCCFVRALDGPGCPDRRHARSTSRRAGSLTRDVRRKHVGASAPVERLRGSHADDGDVRVPAAGGQSRVMRSPGSADGRISNRRRRGKERCCPATGFFPHCSPHSSVSACRCPGRRRQRSPRRRATCAGPGSRTQPRATATCELSTRPRRRSR